MARQTGHSEEELSATLIEGEIRSVYLPEGVRGIAAWEGLLFPATYEFFSDATPEEMLQRLADETERRIDRIDWEPLLRKGISVYEGLVIASLVEAEAGIDEDRTADRRRDPQPAGSKHEVGDRRHRPVRAGRAGKRIDPRRPRVRLTL